MIDAFNYATEQCLYQYTFGFKHLGPLIIVWHNNNRPHISSFLRFEYPTRNLGHES